MYLDFQQSLNVSNHDDLDIGCIPMTSYVSSAAPDSRLSDHCFSFYFPIALFKNET